MRLVWEAGQVVTWAEMVKFLYELPPSTVTISGRQTRSNVRDIDWLQGQG